MRNITQIYNIIMRESNITIFVSMLDLIQIICVRLSTREMFQKKFLVI